MEFGEAEVVGGNFKVTWRLPLEDAFFLVLTKVETSTWKGEYFQMFLLYTCRIIVSWICSLFAASFESGLFIFFVLLYGIHQGILCVLNKSECFVCFELCVL